MKIMIASGGSGGHLFPALKVAAELQRQGHDVFLIGSFAKNMEKVSSGGFAFKNIVSCGFSWIRFWTIGPILSAFFASFKPIKMYCPDVVIGFGGYGSFPAVLAALVLRYPTMIHEQNVIPGRANALLAKCVNKIAVSFSSTQQRFKKDKVVLTGCPCHSEESSMSKEEIYRMFGLNPVKKTVLVFGGSQGSHNINEAFMGVLPDVYGEVDVQVIHLSGEKDFSDLQNQYKSLGISVALFPFSDKIQEAYKVADVVVARAGAGTVTEIALRQLSAILIPYPYARGHQKYNAESVEYYLAVDIIEEDESWENTLKEKLTEKLLCDYPLVDQKYGNEVFFPDAHQRIAQEALKLVS